MESKRDCGDLTCEVCEKEFSCISSKNKHLRKFHDKTTEGKKTQRILCPQCPQEERFTSYDNLTIHLQQIHNVSISESVLGFKNLEDFEAWRELENREVDYACSSRRKLSNGEEKIYYNCNRSDCRGFSSTCKKRTMKSGGSIRIRGVCPSRILATMSRDGSVSVKFIETHVGHADEVRTKRLSKSEQKIIVGQLTTGVTNGRIIQDARKSENDTLKRINIITKGDLAHLSRKFNVNKLRDSDEPTTSEINYQNDVHFVKVECELQNSNNLEDFDEKREVFKCCELQNSNNLEEFDEKREVLLDEIWKEISTYGRTLDETAFEKFITDLKKLTDSSEEVACKKIKIEKIEIENCTL